MSGRRDVNLRSGDLHESFGLLMLQSIAAVAPVPRTEDVGMDAICTLLESAPASSRNLIARESFAVQIKASSVRFVEFRPHEVEWLLALELPLFFGVVSMEDSELRLYTLNNLVRKLHLTRAVTYPTGIVVELVAGSYSGPVPSSDVGPPVASWKLAESKSLRPTLIATMRRWCELEQLNLRLRPLDSGEFYRWQSNCLPEREGGFYSSSGTEHAVAALARPIETLALAGLASSNPDQLWRFWRPFVELLEINGQLAPGTLAGWDVKAKAFTRGRD